MTIASRLKQRRLEMRLSQELLAKKAKVSQQLIGKLETGAARETRKLVQIAEALDVSPEWLASGNAGGDESHALGLDTEMLKSAIVSVKEALKATGLELDAFLAAPMISFAYAERARLPRNMTKEEYRAFDAMVTSKLGQELGDERRSRKAFEGGSGGDEVIEADRPKARRSVTKRQH